MFSLVVSISLGYKGRATLSFERRALWPSGVSFFFFSRAVGLLRWLRYLVRAATATYGCCWALLVGSSSGEDAFTPGRRKTERRVVLNFECNDGLCELRPALQTLVDRIS
jgi:hypothetical protein